MNIYRVGPALLTLALLCVDAFGGSSSKPGGGEEDVRLIVLLKSPPLCLRLKAIHAQSAMIQAEKLAVETGRKTFIRDLRDRGLIQEVHCEFGYLLNGFAATTRARDRHVIAALPEVQGVYIDQERQLEREWQSGTEVQSAIHPVVEYQGQLLTGQGTTIAIVDTGIDYTHPDLGGCFGPGCKVKGGWDFGENDSDPMDADKHGTHVAGIAAANGQMKGVAPEASLLVYKIYNSKGTSVSWMLQALERASDPDGDPSTPDQPDVINLSLAFDGGPDSPGALAADRLAGLGIVVVGAAGNSGPLYWTIVAPGSAAKVITVGAPLIHYTLLYGTRGPKQLLRPSKGPVGDFLPKPDVVAPGMNILSTVPGGGYRPGQGTSMSSPHVAGLVALLRQAHKDWSPETIKASLMNTADGSFDPLAQGCGMPNVERAARTRFIVTPGILSFGRITQAAGNWSASRELSITNLSATSQTYSLTAEGVYQHDDATPLPGVSLTVTPSSLTLDPGSAAHATVTFVIDLSLTAFPTVFPFAYHGRAKIESSEQEVSVPIIAGRVPPPPPDQAMNVARVLATQTAQPLNLYPSAMSWEQHVVGLFARGFNLSGRLPAEIGQLKSLQLLELGNNALTGEIPPELADLRGLEWLDLEGNQFTGSIPALLGTMTRLQGLALGSNHLTGTIPPELGQLTRLESLSLAGNSLTGGIPSSLARLPQLVYLNLDNNLLARGLSVNCGEFKQLEWLSLRNNGLEGPISPNLADIPGLVNLDLSENLLTGGIPPVLGQLLRLNVLNLGHNQLTGTIPTELGSLKRLRELRLIGNRLSGRIPIWVTQLRDLEVLDLSSNFLTGSIPPELSKLSALAQLDLSGNSLTGVIPASLGELQNLTSLNLAHNRLGGPIPSELGNLTKLASLDLSFNHFTGVVPEDFTKLKPVLGLRLDNNHLTAGSETVRQFLDQYHSAGVTWSSSQSPWPGILGDLNGDGVKDVMDLVGLLRLVRRMDALNPDTLKAGDRNGDQAVDAMDLRLLVPLH